MQRKNNIVLRLHRQRRPEQVLLPLVREENGEALRIILEKQDNVTAEFTQRTEKRVRSGWLKLEIEQDGCRRSDNLEEELPVILEVETDIRPEAMTAMYLLNDWWTRPAFIEDFSEIPELTQAIYGKLRNGYFFLLPMPGKQFKTQVKPGRENTLIFGMSACKGGISKLDEPVYAYAEADSLQEAVHACMAWAAEYHGIRLKEERNMPEMLKYLGWCSWDAFYTEISEAADGQLTVKKVPSQKKAAAHVRNLGTICEELTGMYKEEEIEVNRCRIKGDCAQLEYLTGITLEDKLDHLLEEGRTEELEKLFFSYIQKVKNIHEKKPFEKTPEFVRVFGNVNLRSDLKCTEISNIDFVPANIILSENKVSVIDYEWTFAFPVPSQFLVYRMIFYYLELNDKRGILKERDFYEKAGILPEDIEVYVEMEHNFQQYILGEHTAMRNMYAQISPGRVEVEDYYREKKQESLEMLQIFWDNGKSFNEADSVRYLFRNGKIQTEFELPENTTMLRLDPGEMSKGLKIVKLTWEDESQVKFHTDGCEVSSGEFYFGGDDPQIIVDSVPENRKSIKIEMEILDRKTTEKKFWKVYAEQKRAMEQMSQELAQKKALVDQVEGSKAWKVYRAIKRV